MLYNLNLYIGKPASGRTTFVNEQFIQDENNLIIDDNLSNLEELITNHLNLFYERIDKLTTKERINVFKQYQCTYSKSPNLWMNFHIVDIFDSNEKIINTLNRIFEVIRQFHKKLLVYKNNRDTAYECEDFFNNLDKSWTSVNFLLFTNQTNIYSYYSELELSTIDFNNKELIELLHINDKHRTDNHTRELSSKLTIDREWSLNLDKLEGYLLSDDYQKINRVSTDFIVIPVFKYDKIKLYHRLVKANKPVNQDKDYRYDEIGHFESFYKYSDFQPRTDKRLFLHTHFYVQQLDKYETIGYTNSRMIDKKVTGTTHKEIEPFHNLIDTLDEIMKLSMKEYITNIQPLIYKDDSVEYDYYSNNYYLHQFISIVDLVNYISKKNEQTNN